MCSSPSVKVSDATSSRPKTGYTVALYSSLCAVYAGMWFNYCLDHQYKSRASSCNYDMMQLAQYSYSHTFNQKII